MAQAAALDPGERAIAAALAPLGAGVAIDASVVRVADVPLDELRDFATRARLAGLAPVRVWGWASQEDADWRQLVFVFQPVAGESEADLRERFAALLDDAAAAGASPELLDRISFEA